ncbi:MULTISPECIES: 2-C-methyl-D-erythritol 4-phosphate cytidylyltransferase [Pseudoalteromonas]|uniref:2-C-methyl-D-erythritol 4-phosphate cytidylyltransferase n=1 Tax=Pseudoalteromonas TaxID=53246 RepID=UPI0011097976|nr:MULTISPECIES: 2-C-methyl-D-erythritol 4-phosphate cytidylyltransferase [Pseudoalteromonas]MCG9757659.1 2-C-methyl-D-erythritol 4-phosphate cytidylyltransferase [Pseudoalteromonas sp. Isolate6]NKC17546.1 2-C-methyl-D-erythritol 4-phosphate cytidylyltransferase [Pseudoalteromonas galatheae]
MKRNDKLAVVIPAAGVGSRMQAQMPKQYIPLLGKPILVHTLEKLAGLECVDQFMVAVSKEDGYFSSALLPDSRFSHCEGGQERADSVLLALKALAPSRPDWVLVHDAARPLVALEDIHHLIAKCVNEGQGGILAAKVKDTIKCGTELVQKTVPRESLWQAFTPQMFKYEELLAALELGLAQGANVTDEASAMELQKKPVQLIAARTDNIKITTPEDLPLAEFIIQQQGKQHD